MSLYEIDGCQSPLLPIAAVFGIDAIYGAGDCHLFNLS